MYPLFTNRRYWIVAVIVNVAAIVMLIVANMLNTPSIEVVPKEESAAEFSAERVFDHLKEFAQQPRHPGTAYHGKARGYIAETIRAMDVPVAIEESTGLHDHDELPIHNIIATLEGTGPGKEIIIMAHYDSVKEGPGANDDGVNAGVMLETLRVLKQEQRLQNTVVFLFTDGEETGLFGAKDYLKKHSSENIGFVLNLEARGYKGPMLLFETSGSNGLAIKLFNEQVTHPYAFSFFEDLYQYLPHDTDFTPFKKEDVPGFNFAYVEGAEVYHTRNDNLNFIHLPTVQHSGQYALSMAKALGAYDLSAIGSKGDYAYFNVFGHYMMMYPTAWNVALTAFALLLFASAVWYCRHKRAMQLRSSMKWVIFVFVSVMFLQLFGTFFYIAYSMYKYRGISSFFLIYLTVAKTTLSI